MLALRRSPLLSHTRAGRTLLCARRTACTAHTSGVARRPQLKVITAWRICMSCPTWALC